MLKALATALLVTLTIGLFTPQALAATALGSGVVDESIFPDNYPKFLKQTYVLLREAECMRQLSVEEREDLLEDQGKELQLFFQDMLAEEELDVARLWSFARAQAGQAVFDRFLKRFGIERDDPEDIELEVLAQINRIRRREAQHDFAAKFNAAGHDLASRVQLVERSKAPRELEYALRNCWEEEFETLLDIVMSKKGFGPQTSQDRNVLNYLKKKRSEALDKGKGESEMKWRAVIAQLVSQPVGRKKGRLPFSNRELFAMMRNAERTVEQRKRPFVNINSIEELDGESAFYAKQMIKKLGIDIKFAKKDQVIVFGSLDETVGGDLNELRKIYEDILSNKDSGQTEATVNSVRSKKELIERLESSKKNRIDMRLKSQRAMLLELVRKILGKKEQSYRLRFIRGVVLFKGEEGKLSYCFIEDFPMIVAGDTYPYQWKHDNEVNIALLLANVDPYLAAQAVRFIIYHGMWRGKEAKRIGLYGWLSQIIFGNRQTGKMPVFKGKTYYYCPDFRLRPTKKMDSENERTRTSEIMQLPFFGWTVWRVYEEMKKTNKEHALAFLKEVYPYVRANTEAIRTALDPFDEAVLSGRDAWVNGMDNAWYHLMVMYRHLPERFIPTWAMEMIDKYRVDNRVGKIPGNPVDPELAKGRPSDYYYTTKFVFYDIIKRLALEPFAVYHATHYNAKDIAITGIMARSLKAQIDMAKVLKNTTADVHKMGELRGRKDELVRSWDEEIDRYREYLDRMKKAMNRYHWSPEDKLYYNRDVTQMFPGVVEQQFCRIRIDKENRVRYEPIEEYWNLESKGKVGGRRMLSQKALESSIFNPKICSVSIDEKGNIHYEYNSLPQYWKWEEGGDGSGHFQLDVKAGDPFIVEQFCALKKDKKGNIYYEPDLRYWTKVADKEGAVRLELNEKAKGLMGRGARKIEDGELLRSPAIASFFPLFGGIPTKEQAFQLSMQAVNPWTWWPVDGMPIPTQPMMKLGADGEYVPNEEYDPDKYWRGPTWMASSKPVMDGFNSYGYQMMYLFLVRRTVGTLQDGRAVEHWNPETGKVNTSNVNFPWAASGMAGSIWQELTQEEQHEYLRRFH